MTSTTTNARQADSAAATSAASGMDIKAKRPALQTPVSASYPSELRSPAPGTPAYLTREEAIKTPISPPTAYVDYLKSHSPLLMSPPTTSGSTSRFPNSEKTFNPSEEAAQGTGLRRQPSAATPSGTFVAPQHPSLSRNTSTDSSTSISTASTGSTESLPSHIAGEPRAKPQSPRIIIPPSPFPRPSSARTPRNIHVPQSPFSAASVRSPMSARSMQSPYSTSALTATPLSATFSPRTALTSNLSQSETKIKDGKVCIRHVITRTVTYCRTPIDPAPKGKRRKLGEDSAGESSEASESKEDVKQELHDP